MKRKILSILLASTLVCGLLIGCGNNAEPVMGDDGVVTLQTEEPSVAETPTPTEAPTPEPTEEPTPEPTEEPEPEMAMDWFAENGLTITPQGDFTYTTIYRDGSGVELGTFDVMSHAVITETMEGVEEGYKKVIFTLTDDISANSGNGYRYWYSALDRYTGTSFEFDSTTVTASVGQTAHEAGFVTIVNGDVSYDVSIAFETTNSAPIFTNIITVTCPADYDGVVFQVGYWDSELANAYNAIDFKARLYTVDELPAWGDGYYYFSYSNE